MNKSILIATLIVLTLSLNLIAATETTLGTFKQNECVNLKTLCANCTSVNITSVTYPNSTNAMGAGEMTRIGSEYNYTFCKTDALGVYIVNNFADLDGKPTVANFNFEITSTGGNTSSSLIVIFLSAAAIIILVFGIWIKNEYIGILAGMLFIVDGIYIMIYGLGNLSDMYTRALAFTALGLGLFVFIAASYDVINRDSFTILPEDFDD